MGLLSDVAKGEPARVSLARDLRRAILRGHPWVFGDALRPLPAGVDAGAVGRLADKRGKPLAAGYLDPRGPLALRICTTDPRERVDDAWAARRLTRALALREALFGGDADTDGYRLVNGEGDGLPGLVVDVYGDAAVLKLDGPVAAAFWDSAGVAAWIAERRPGLTTIYERFRTRAGPAGRPLVGATPAAPVAFREHGARFSADLVRGQKTGFFLDQRDNRRRVGRLSRGRRVLNVFGYTGGFSVLAGLGGAAHVTTVDLAAPAIADADAHWRRNGLPPDRHEGVAGDAFAFLEAAAAARRRWDLVVLDPPAFAPSKRARGKAIGAYTKLVAAGARVTAPGGVCVAASCSAHVTSQAFVDVVTEGVGQARRRAEVLGVYGQPADHPAPLACPELRYLDAIFLRLDG